MRVARVRNAGRSMLSVRHVCGSGERTAPQLGLFLIVSVELITLTDGFLIRKV